MSQGPEGWHIAPGAPAWDAEAKTFSFYLRKAGRKRVRCILAIDALEKAVPSNERAGADLTKVFDAHRQLIELRAAQKLNAGVLEPDGTVRVGAADI